MVKVDKAAVDYYIHLTEFFRQFQTIGNNYNQVVRTVKTNFGEKRAAALLYKLEKAMLELILIYNAQNEKSIFQNEKSK